VLVLYSENSVHITCCKEPRERLNFLRVAKEYIDSAVECIEQHGRRLGNSLMLGSAGVYLVACLIYDAIPDKRREYFSKFYNLYVSLADSWLRNESEDEFLYGKAGFLTGFLYFHGHNEDWETYARRIVMKLIESGRNTAKNSSWSGQCPLLYRWHHKFYLGAAHGTVGILHTLLLVASRMNGASSLPDEQVKQTLEFMHQLKCPDTNNYFSSLDSKHSELVQWCHGAPGFIYLFCEAAEYYSNAAYLNYALEASEPVWKYGWLRKGPGLCHGISGNAYCFLRLFRCLRQFPDVATEHEKRSIVRAVQMGAFLVRLSTNSIPCVDDAELGMRVPDRPFSLYEGISGTGCFLLDLLNPLQSRFPLFDEI